MLSKKYYKQIAQILGKENAKENVINAFVVSFKADNYRFSEGKFTEAIKKARGEN